MSAPLIPARAHDLPPKWDGRPVIWHGWNVLPSAIVCPPPPPTCCRFCGSMTPNVLNRGSRRVIEGRDRWMPSLMAWRCPECRRDQVHDLATDEVCDLEDSDYEDEGSR